MASSKKPPSEASKQNTVAPEKSATTLTPEEINHWFEEKNIHPSISKQLRGCSGATLSQIDKMVKNSPVFLYEKLLADDQLTLADLANFTNELEKLFKHY